MLMISSAVAAIELLLLLMMMTMVLPRHAIPAAQCTGRRQNATFCHGKFSITTILL